MRIALATLCLMFIACGEPREPAPPPPPGDGSVTRALRLSLLDEIEGRLRLRSEEGVDLRFYLDDPATEEPIEGASIICATVGADGGSSASSASTDAAGEASISLETGSSPAYFALRCTATRSNVVELGAAVSPSFEFHDAPFSAAYEGERNLRGLRAMLIAGSTCDAAVGAEPAASLTGSADETLSFESVPVELRFALVLELTDSKNRPGARGCAYGLLADGEPRVIELEDLPFSPTGEYPARLDLEAPSLAVDLAAAGETSAYAAIGADDGSFLFGRLMSALIAQDMHADYQQLQLSQADHATDLRVELQNSESGPSYAVNELAGLVESSSGALRLEGGLSIEGNAPSYPIRFRTSAIRAGSSLASLMSVRLADFEGDPDGVGIATEMGDEYELEADLSFGFTPSAMILAGARSALDNSALGALGEHFGCGIFVRFYAFDTLVQCDEGCRTQICESALDETIQAFYNGVRSASGFSSLQLDFDMTIDAAGGAFPDRIDVAGLVARFGGGTVLPSATLTID